MLFTWLRFFFGLYRCNQDILQEVNESKSADDDDSDDVENYRASNRFQALGDLSKA
jgi:hypothetical protein